MLVAMIGSLVCLLDEWIVYLGKDWMLSFVPLYMWLEVEVSFVAYDYDNL